MPNETIPNIPVLATQINDSDLFEKADGTLAGQSQRVPASLLKGYVPALLLESGSASKLSDLSDASQPFDGSELFYTVQGSDPVKIDFFDLVNQILNAGTLGPQGQVEIQPGDNHCNFDNSSGQFYLDSAGGSFGLLLQDQLGAALQIMPGGTGVRLQDSSVTGMFTDGTGYLNLTSNAGNALRLFADGDVQLADGENGGISISAGIVTFTNAPIIPGTYTGTLAGAAGKNVVNGLIQA